MERHTHEASLTWAKQIRLEDLDVCLTHHCWSSPRWKAQQRSGLQSLWPWQIVPSVPAVALTVHCPHTHIWSEQHSSSLVQGWVGGTHIQTWKHVCKAHMVCCCIHGLSIFLPLSILWIHFRISSKRHYCMCSSFHIEIFITLADFNQETNILFVTIYKWFIINNNKIKIHLIYIVLFRVPKDT